MFRHGVLRFNSGLVSHNLTTTTTTRSIAAAFQAKTATTFAHRSIRYSSSLVETQFDEEKGIATLYMNSPPVNSLSWEM
jgi:hypothetical protein